MSSLGSVSRWLMDLQAGERAGVQELWEGYFQKLVLIAQRKLGRVPQRVADPEDVALSAFDSFVRGAERGRFPQLEDRHDLWQVLVMITCRKAVDVMIHEGRDKRDWHRVIGQPEDPAASGALLKELLARDPDPAFACEVADECRRLLGELPDDEVRQVALRKMEGFTHEEIADQLGIAVVTVGRRLALIRQTWAEGKE
jgi:DNA-directed RNA polymerase specialized sigma24 family protein